MRAIRKKNNYLFELSEEVYDLDGNDYLWKDLILCPEDDEQVNYRLEQLEIEKLRQEYAGLVLQAILGNSNPTVVNAFGERADKEGKDIHQAIAEGAVEWADALIEILKKDEK